MKALHFDGKLTLREVPTPRPAPGEALIRVLFAGICGTDREILKGYSGFHGIPGHEFVGRVVEADDGFRNGISCGFRSSATGFPWSPGNRPFSKRTSHRPDHPVRR